MPSASSGTKRERKRAKRGSTGGRESAKRSARADTADRAGVADVVGGTVVRSRKGEKDGAKQRAKERGRKRGGKRGKEGRDRANPKRGRRSKGARAKRKREPITKKNADRHALYQFAVQSPDEDVAFLRRVYRKHRQAEARHLREDFCGTGLLASAWIRKGDRFTAEGFDIDPDPVSWGMAHNFEPLGEDAGRASIHLKDVREPSHRRPDVRVALNFSWFVFKERPELVEYFRAACDDLAEGGVFVLDIYGGPEAMMEMDEERDIDEGYRYVWDQKEYVPATGEYRCAIHFEFEDGSEKRNAFRYDWRLWGLPEARDALLDAGFREVVSYWEGTAEDGESGNGIFRLSKKGENCLTWVTYLVALK